MVVVIAMIVLVCCSLLVLGDGVAVCHAAKIRLLDFFDDDNDEFFC